MRWRAIVALALLACATAGGLALGQGIKPARTVRQIQMDIEDIDVALGRLMERTTMLGSIKERPDVAKDYVPLLKKRIALQEELARTPGSGGAASVRGALLEDTAALIALGDTDTEKMVASTARLLTPTEPRRGFAGTWPTGTPATRTPRHRRRRSMPCAIWRRRTPPTK